MRFIGVFNRDGGTFRSRDMEAFCQSARDIFASAGHELDCRIVDGPALMAVGMPTIRP